MKRLSLAAFLFVLASLIAGVQAQTPQIPDSSPSQETRPRIVQPAPSQGQPSASQQRPLAESESLETIPLGTVVGTKPDARPQVAGPAATEHPAEAVVG